jgi:GT2 family glycosyltransferase
MSNQKPVLDIAVLTAGRVDLFDRCIHEILHQMKPEYRIQVFNNGSPSQDYEEIYKTLPEGSIVKRTNQNLGYPGGANNAIRAGSSPLVLFVSDDIFLDDGTIEQLVKRMNDESSIGLCGLKLRFPPESKDPTRPAGRVQHVGHAVNIRGDIVHPMIGWTTENPRTNISREVMSVTGACFIVRRQIFNQAGGFNTIYGTGYFEDVDLNLTIRKLGYKIFIDTEATAIHGVGETYKTKPDVQVQMQQNQQIFRSRHMNDLMWSEVDMW